MTHISIISHMHGSLVYEALNLLSISAAEVKKNVYIWITLNMPEPNLERSIRKTQWPFDVRIIKNSKPMGFGANHNQAFACAQALRQVDWFLVINPDVFWPADAQQFWQQLEKDNLPANVGLLCPQQVAVNGELQDFMRILPTPWGLVRRALRRCLGLQPNGVASCIETADWVNGACMVWRASVFAALNGFDERYHLYGEDVDICLRLQLADYTMASTPLTVVHDAQRQTASSWRHLAWHVSSLVKLWLSVSFWRYVWRLIYRTYSFAKHNGKL